MQDLLASAPVSQLSDDILGHIFLLFNVSNNFKPIRNWDLYSTTTRATSQVCQQWREVSLSLPQLWRNIEITGRSSRWTEELLYRSKSYSLQVVSLNMDSSILDDQLKPEHIARLVSFVGYLSERVWNQITIDLQKPTSQLEILDIHNLDSIIFNHVDISKTQSSSLKELYIHDPGFSWGSPLFVNLSILAIATTRYPADLLLAALQGMTLLTELTLSRALSSFGYLEDNIFRLPRVSLLKLHYLSIYDECASVAKFLARLEIPELCTMDVALRKASIGPLLTSISSLVFKKIIQTHNSHANPSLNFTINETRSVSFSNAPPGPYYAGPWAVSNENFKKQFSKLRLIFDGEWLPHLHHFTSSLETIIPSTRCLSVNLTNITDVSKFLLRSFTGVTHLCLKNDNTIGRVIDLLSPKSSDDIIFPSLNKLTLIPRYDVFNRYFDNFITCLQSRESAGYGIKILELCPEWYAYNKGQLSDKHITRLESLIKLVPFYHMANGLVVKTSFWDDLSPKTVRDVLPFKPVSVDWTRQFISASQHFDFYGSCDDDDGSMSDSYNSD